MVLLAHAQRLGQHEGQHGGDVEDSSATDQEYDRKVEAVVRNLDLSRKKAEGRVVVQGKEMSWRGGCAAGQRPSGCMGRG